MQRKTLRYAHTRTETHTHTEAHFHTNRRTCTHTHTHARAQAQAHTHIHTHSHRQTRIKDDAARAIRQTDQRRLKIDVDGSVVSTGAGAWAQRGQTHQRKVQSTHDHGVRGAERAGARVQKGRASPRRQGASVRARSQQRAPRRAGHVRIRMDGARRDVLALLAQARPVRDQGAFYRWVGRKRRAPDTTVHTGDRTREVRRARTHAHTRGDAHTRDALITRTRSTTPRTTHSSITDTSDTHTNTVHT